MAGNQVVIDGGSSFWQSEALRVTSTQGGNRIAAVFVGGPGQNNDIVRVQDNSGNKILQAGTSGVTITQNGGVTLGTELYSGAFTAGWTTTGWTVTSTTAKHKQATLLPYSTTLHSLHW